MYGAPTNEAALSSYALGKNYVNEPLSRDARLHSHFGEGRPHVHAQKADFCLLVADAHRGGPVGRRPGSAVVHATAKGGEDRYQRRFRPAFPNELRGDYQSVGGPVGE